jgi:hypothetical protein
LTWNLKASEAIAQLGSALVLRRAAVLLTVWSNCLAGWWLGGGNRYPELPFLLGGAALLFAGGTLWNDAYAVGLVPGASSMPYASARSGRMGTAQWCGLGLLVLGVTALSLSGNVTGGLGLALAVLVIVGHVLHRLGALVVIQPAVCRLLFYLMGASVGVIGITGQSIWCGLALAIYVVGYLPHQRDAAGPERYWPILLLAVPIFLALIVDDDGSRQAGLVFSAVLALWAVRCLRPALWSAEKDFVRASAGLVAGIALVDLLAVAGGPKALSAVFIALFLAVRGLQELAARR